MNFVDSLLNKITMYKLVLYVLLTWVFVGFTYSIFGIYPFNIGSYIFSLISILTASYFSNLIFAKLYKVPVNIESSLISGLIIFLVYSPVKQIEGLLPALFVSVLTQLSKYIFAINRKHIFNPVAISIFVSSIIFKILPSWWIGNISMLPFIIFGGLLIIKKIRRWDLLLGFIVAVLLTVSPSTWPAVLKDTTLIFFTAIMLVDPLTTPPTKLLRIAYGALIGFLFYNQTPEVALIIGNIFSYIVSPKFRLMLSLDHITQLTHDTYDFVFKLNKPVKFIPGQYMEFTFDHPKPDLRGNRRYLSLASSPTESEIRLGVKIGSRPSSYKKNLLLMKPNHVIAAGQLIGDFTLPKDPSRKLVLIAGGIGITPYRSMIKYLIDTNQKRDMVVIYSVRNKDEFVYADVLEAAKKQLGIRTISVETSSQGRMNMVRLAKEIPDYTNRTFYISGSFGVVKAFEKMLKDLKVSHNKIVTDYFPGFV